MTKRCILLLLVFVFVLTEIGCQQAQTPVKTCKIAKKAGSCIDQGRKAARWRKRNLIMHHDGHDSRSAFAPDTIEGYLSLRLNHIDNCGIDTLYFCTTSSNGRFMHDTKAGLPLPGKTVPGYAKLNRLPGLLEQGTDPLKLAIETCRKNNMEVFWTHRMNDIHDNWRPAMVSPWKKNNPQLLMGTADDINKYPFSDPRHIWSFLNYEYKQVRDKQVSYFKEVANQYDVDGVDMDFLRHPCYFKESRLNKPVTKEHMDMLTEMVARIHSEVLEASKKKGRPILISTRILPTLELNRRFGFDVETWAKKGYVDVFILGCGYDPFTTPAKDMINHAHNWGMPAYICLSGSGMTKMVEGSSLDRKNIEAWRGAAANAWHLGADGIHNFNLYPQLPGTEQTKLVRSVWQDISDPQKLALKDKLFIVDNLKRFVLESCFTVGTVQIENRLPAKISKEQTTRHILVVGDNIPEHVNKIKDLTLRVCLTDSSSTDSIAVAFNAEYIPLEPEEPNWWTGQVPADIINPGDNVVAVTYKDGKSETLELASIELMVRYSSQAKSEHVAGHNKRPNGKTLGHIFNSDGPGLLLLTAGKNTTPAEYKQLVLDMLDMEMDVLAQNVGLPDPVLYHSKIATTMDKYYIELRAGGDPNAKKAHRAVALRKLFEAETDLLKITIQACKEKGVLCLASYRMNSEDFYHNNAQLNMYDFGRKHKNWRIPGRNCLDPAIPEVFQHRMDIFREVAENYDIDGIEFDFRRWYFMVSNPHENYPVLTRMVRQIRQMLDEVAEKKGRKKLLLGVRVGPCLDCTFRKEDFPGAKYNPHANDSCRNYGLDVKTWIEKGYVDYVCPALFWPYLPGLPNIKEFAELAKGTNVGIYPTVFPLPAWGEQVDNPVANTAQTRLRHQKELLQVALQCYDEGADGISTFNWPRRKDNTVVQKYKAVFTSKKATTTYGRGSQGFLEVVRRISPILKDHDALQKLLQQTEPLPEKIVDEPSVKKPDKQTKNPTEDERRKAVWRKRRVIFNNDGDDARLTEAAATPEGFLSIRMNHVADCGVDTVFYCTSWSLGCFTHNTKVGQVFDFKGKGHFQQTHRTLPLIEQGTDTLDLAIKACRKHDIDIFWTHRMNDIHDNWRPERMAQWKKDRPQVLMGTFADYEKYPQSKGIHWWSFVNYAHQEPRDLAVAMVCEVANNYDVDGINLDFLRHICYFPETRLYKPVTAEHMNLLTQMMRRVRDEVTAAEKRKGKPILVTVRVLPTLKQNKYFGFDVERWVAEKYIDFIVVGDGTDPFTMPARDMIERGHAWGIPVYRTLSGSGFKQPVENSGVVRDSVEAWRGAAANVWAQGADGIMTFNLFPRLGGTEKTQFARIIWGDICDETGLAGKDKIFAIENLHHYYHNAGYLMRSVSIEKRLPVNIKKGQTVNRILPIGDNISQQADNIKELNLRIFLTDSKSTDIIKLTLNTQHIPLESEEPNWWKAAVPHDVVNPGDNVVAITYEKGQSETLTLASIELRVRYTEKCTKPVSIVVESDADPLIKFAADELKTYIEKIYGIDATIVSKASERGLSFNIKVVTKDLSDQGILIQPHDNVLTIAGGSPQATLWAVYELVQRWGVRYLIDSDVLPENPGQLKFPEKEIKMEPNMRIRCWRLLNTLPPGPISWSWQDNRRFLRQIAKMKYNRIHASMWSLHPFVQYSFRGMEKPPGMLYFGFKYPIDDDTIGKEKFGEMTEFTNPELYGAKSPAELVERGIALAGKILNEAKALGIQPGISIRPFEWHKQFMEVLPGSEIAYQVGMLEAGPGKNQSMEDPLLREMIATIVRAYVSTYPQAEYIHIGLPEHRSWVGFAPQAYDKFDKQYNLSDIGTYDQLCAKARNRSYALGNERSERMLKSDLAMLWFFDSLVREKNLLRRPNGSNAKLIYRGIGPELYPLIGKMMPPGGEIMATIDYTASLVLEKKEYLEKPPSDPVAASVIFTLADDNIGVLPQSATYSLHELLKVMRTYGWEGFYTRYWTVGDLDLSAHFLSLASWDANVTPEDAVRDFIQNVCGQNCVEPVLKVFSLIEETTVRLDKKELGVAFCVPNMMGKHYSKGKFSETLTWAHENYRQAFNHMQTAYQNCRPGGRHFLKYHLNRLHFAVKYLDAAEHFAATGRLERAGELPEAAKQAKQAYQDIRLALQLWTDVARDYGDLGAIAAMNEYCYRPIRKKYKKSEP